MRGGINYNWTALSYEADEDKVAIMYRKLGKKPNGEQEDTLEEYGWISQSEIWLDNGKIKEFVANINPKVALGLNHSPEKYASDINQSIDYEVYRMTGIKFFGDRSKNENTIINDSELSNSREDVIKTTLKAIDEVVRTDYVELYERAKEKATREKMPKSKIQEEIAKVIENVKLSDVNRVTSEINQGIQNSKAEQNEEKFDNVK